MDGSTSQGRGSPPRINPTGDAETSSMKHRTRVGQRLLPWTGAALLLAFSLGAPNGAEARTFKPQGPPYPEGDPTADDQPSPTPKPTRSLNQTQKVPMGAVSSQGFASARLIWLSYVRVWIQITLR